MLYFYDLFTTYLRKLAHQNGTRVFYWDVNGTIKYGTVESTSRMTDVGPCISLLVVIYSGNIS
jgi:hypothetical protein